MKWRQISEYEILETIKSPDKLERSFHGKWNAFKILGRRYIRVTYKPEKKFIMVISVVDKYD